MFGSFEIGVANIGVNTDGHLKVWISSFHEQNTKAQLSTPCLFGNEERKMLESIKNIFSGLVVHTKMVKDLLQVISNQHTFIDLLRTVDTFAKHYQIRVPKNLKNTEPPLKRAKSPPIGTNRIRPQFVFDSPRMSLKVGRNHRIEESQIEVESTTSVTPGVTIHPNQQDKSDF